jgi:hypothetical protein
MRTLYTVGLAALGITLVFGVSCGGSSDDAGFSGTGGTGDAAAGTGGGGSGGAGASSGSGGSDGSGGSGGASGGSAGSGGTGTDAGGCAAPSNASRAALCLTLAPETIAFESDPRLDGSGVLIVDIHNTPQPDALSGGPDVLPLIRLVHPPQPDGGVPVETSIRNVPELRFDDLPATVYVRAFFVDNFEMFAREATTYGVWLGGYDLSVGLVERPPIQAVQLAAGAGRSHTLPMIALRRLRATLALAPGVTPLDDGQGPAAVVAVRSATELENAQLFGTAGAPCVKLGAGSTAELTGILIGSGTFFLSAGIDDFNVGGGLPAGGLIALDVNGTEYSLPAATRVVAGPTAYTVTHTVPLNLVVPLGDGGAPPPYACPISDAGSD